MAIAQPRETFSKGVLIDHIWISHIFLTQKRISSIIFCQEPLIQHTIIQTQCVDDHYWIKMTYFHHFFQTIVGVLRQTQIIVSFFQSTEKLNGDSNLICIKDLPQQCLRFSLSISANMCEHSLEVHNWFKDFPSFHSGQWIIIFNPVFKSGSFNQTRWLYSKFKYCHFFVGSYCV